MYRDRNWPQYVLDNQGDYSEIEDKSQQTIARWRYLPTKDEDDNWAKDPLGRIEENIDDKRVCVRMVTGDCLETAVAVAIRAGIIHESEANNKDIVMDCQTFENKFRNQ